MGRSVTPAHRVEVIDQTGLKWQTVFQGRATEANLKSWILAFNASVVSGHNSHLGAGAQVAQARLVAQKGARRGEVVAEVNV